MKLAFSVPSSLPPPHLRIGARVECFLTKRRYLLVDYWNDGREQYGIVANDDGHEIGIPPEGLKVVD